MKYLKGEFKMYIFDESIVQPLNPGYSLNILKTFNTSEKLTEDEIESDLYKLNIPMCDHEYIIWNMTKLSSSCDFIDNELRINCHQKFYIIESDDYRETIEKISDKYIYLIYDKKLKDIFRYDKKRGLIVLFSDINIDSGIIFRGDVALYIVEFDKKGHISRVKCTCGISSGSIIYSEVLYNRGGILKC